MEKIKLEKSGNFMWVTDLKTNTVTRFPAKDTYYAFEDKNRVLVLTWDKNNGETYHRYRVSQLVDSGEEPWSSFSALDTFLSSNLGFNTGGGSPINQVNSDWDSTSGVSEILNKPTLISSIGNLSQTLLEDNQTGGSNIKVNDGDSVELENGSLLRKGTYDFGGFGDVIVSGITNSGDGYISGIMGWGDPSGTLWSDLNGTYKKTSIAVTPSAFGAGDIGMHTPEPGTYNYYLQLPSNPGFNGVAYFLAPGNRSGWGDPNNDATTDPPVNYWRLCVLSDYPYVYFTNPSTDPFSFPTSGWVPVDDTIPISEGGQGYDYIANYDSGFTADILYILNGNGGISRICSIGYEDNWQAGVRYVFGNSGTIRHATNCFTIVPDSSFDYTKRFAVGSLWTLDNGDTYECLNADLNEAVWKLYSSPIPKYKIFTALLTQGGTSDSIPLSSGDSVIKGTTYKIDGGSDGDFSNVGAPSNEDSTSFIATINGVPNSYGTCSLLYDPGAPIANILENTIGNIWFEYSAEGKYLCKSSTLFTENKTTIDMDAYCQDGNPGCNLVYQTLSVGVFTIGTHKGGYLDGYLSNNRLEIKVYN